MSTIAAFMNSTSGYVSRREGVSLGWMVGAMAGMATILGVADKSAAAGECNDGYIYCGDTVCTSEPCQNSYKRKYLCKVSAGSVCGTEHGNEAACNC